MSLSEKLSVGQRVQVFNPGPMAIGTVIPRPQGSAHICTCWVRVTWEEDGHESWSQADLLRPVEAR